MSKQGFIFGHHAIMEAIHAGREIEKILIKRGSAGELYKQLIDLIVERDLPYQMVPVEKINRITQKNHQGVLAFLSEVEYQSMENLLIHLFEQGETPFLLMLDGVTDVRNFGAIARSALCAGAHAIIVPEKGSAIIGADAVKTSAGALHELPVCRVKSLANAIEYLQNSGLKIVCATEKGREKYYENNFTGPLAIVMGSEDTGISHPVLKKADILCQIPIQGPIGSLNVSVAAGVLLFDVVRQRNQMSPDF